ncbi:MAG: LPS assembly lipoprotein LptE [Pirellulales bacterium]
MIERGRQGSHARTRRGFIAAVLCSNLIVTLGCAGYRFGSSSLYRTDIRTIYVPIVRSESFRPMLGVQLTEALQKNIQERSPYRLVNDPSADSILTCRITNDTKRVITETRTDEARAIDSKLAVRLTWTDRQNNVLMENSFVPPEDIAFLFAQGVTFVPEGGQSITTAEMRAVERLADEIVNQMEARW